MRMKPAGMVQSACGLMTLFAVVYVAKQRTRRLVCDEGFLP
jgi:hypothetical protein